ncbi:MAG TPA: hypothetical protein DDX03_10350 [Firmicutes bacterium]|nr:hypothetical protein [Bacillota bacterium]
MNASGSGNAIGLEVSTSSAKCILCSPTGAVIRSVSIPFDTKTSNTVSQHPGRMMETAIEALRQLVCSGETGKVAIIGLGGTWHSLLLLDSNREALFPISTWADLSASSAAEAIKQDQQVAQRYYHQTGCVVHGMYPAWKLKWIGEQTPEVFRKIALVSTQVGQLFAGLTGTRAISKCMASGSGLLNIHTLDWDPEILALLGMKPEQLEELVEAFHTAPLLPAIAQKVGLPSGIPVTVGCADGALNQVAVSGVAQGVMSFSVGTSGAIRLVQNASLIPEEPSTWCYYLFDQKRLAGAATQGAANCLSWFFKTIGGGDSAGTGRRGENGAAAADGKPNYAAFEKAAAAIKWEEAPYFLPFIYGERCPGWNESRRGGFVGVDATHDQAHLYYAVLEGILFNMYQCYLKLAEVGGVPAEIRVSGGILNSPFWLQMAADIFGKPMLTSGFANDSTVGAAIVALKAAGIIERIEDCLPEIRHTYQPRAEYHRRYQARFGHYLGYYASTAASTV